LKLHFEDDNIVSKNQSDNSSKQFIEVCSGAGGLSTGFIANNFKPKLLNDNDKYCVETLKLNHPNIPIHFGDMRSIDLKEYSDTDIDVLIGGIPCQPFSQIGKRNGLSDVNGEIIFHFIQMTDVLKPKVFVVENVTGLLTLNNGEVLRFILKKFDNLKSYKIHVKVLNANDYGVPQNRKRLFIIGVKNTVNKVFKFPEEHDYKPVLRDALTNCRESDGRVYDKETRKLFELIPEGGC